jgi:hypothetical protein
MKMSFDFDTVHDRRGTDSLKWSRYKDRDVIPMWVADMDFRSPEPVIEALHRRVEQGIFGYASPPPEPAGGRARCGRNMAIDCRGSWLRAWCGVERGVSGAEVGRRGGDVCNGHPRF